MKSEPPDSAYRLPRPETTVAGLPRRDPLFDVLKGLMMVWIVWGHLALYRVVEWVPTPWMANAKIGMNMPVFFLLAGFFAVRTFERASTGKIVARIVSFLWPMAAFGVVFGLVLCLEGKGGGLGWFAGFVPRRLLRGHWYLRTFTAIYLCSAVIWRCLPRNWMRLIGFAALYAALIFLPAPALRIVKWAEIQPMVHMLPYFAFGLFLPDAVDAVRRHARFAVPCALFFLAVVFLEGDSSTNGMNFWNVPMKWRTVLLTRQGLLTFLGRTAVGLSGSLAALFVLDRLLRRIPKTADALAVFGTTTLGVYVLHEWPLMQIGAAKLSWLPLPAWTRWPVALGWFLACHAIIVLIRRMAATRIFFFGDEKRLASAVDWVSGRLAALVRHRKKTGDGA